MKEQVQEISVCDLHGFKNHPFQVKDDDPLNQPRKTRSG